MNQYSLKFIRVGLEEKFNASRLHLKESKSFQIALPTLFGLALLANIIEICISHDTMQKSYIILRILSCLLMISVSPIIMKKIRNYLVSNGLHFIQLAIFFICSEVLLAGGFELKEYITIPLCFSHIFHLNFNQNASWMLCAFKLITSEIYLTIRFQTPPYSGPFAFLTASILSLVLTSFFQEKSAKTAFLTREKHEKDILMLEYMIENIFFEPSLMFMYKPQTKIPKENPKNQFLPGLSLLELNEKARTKFHFKKEMENTAEILKKINVLGRTHENASIPKPQSTEDKKNLLQYINEQLVYFEKDLMEGTEKEGESENLTPYFLIKLNCNYNIPNIGKESNLKVLLFYFKWINNYRLILRLQDQGLKERVNYLQELDLFKNRFLASITHDLRTPLNGVEVMIQSAMYEEDAKERFECLQIASISSKLLMNLVNDILDHSQFQEKKFRIVSSKFLLSNLLDEVMSLMRIQASLRNLELKLFNYCPEELEMNSDPTRIKQVLINLLGNSLKFTIKGYVHLVVTKLKEEVLKFEVIDSGSGINSKNLKHLAEPFFTDNNDVLGLNRRGIGLGLFNCKNIVSHLGPKNKLYISSQEGKGSKIGFLLFKSKNCQESSLNKNIFMSVAERIHNTGNFNGSQNANIPLGEVHSSTPRHYSDLTETFKVTRPNREKNSSIIQNINESKGSSQHELSGEFSSFKYDNFLEEEGLDMNDLIIQEQLLGIKTKVHKVPSNLEEISRNVPEVFKKTARILIVDDNPFNLVILEKFFKKLTTFNLFVERATNGQIAVELFNQRNHSGSKEPFQIIFMDCFMPIKNGFEATQEIVELTRKGWMSSFIIGFTGLLGPEEKSTGLRSGMNKMLSKPAHEKEVLDLISDILSHKILN